MVKMFLVENVTTVRMPALNVIHDPFLAHITTYYKVKYYEKIS